MWLVALLEENLEKMYSLGADSTRIYAGYFYKDQCNFGFSAQEIVAVSRLNINFDISCYDVTEDEG